MHRRFLPLLPVLAFLLGCSKEPSSATGGRVTVAVALDQEYAESLLREFEKSSGLQVDAHYDTEATKTTGLVQTLLAERARPRTDVFWNNELSQTIRLQNEGVLAPYAPTSATDLPARWRDPEGHWTAFGARARVMLVNTDRVKPGAEPRSVREIADPRWKGRACLGNPLFGTTATHAAALFETLGDEAARKLFLDAKANGVVVAASNGQAMQKAANGEVDWCLTDTDDAAAALREKKPVRIVFPDQEDGGALLIPNSVALVKGGPNPAGARRLIEFIAGAGVERRLAAGPSVQIPLRPDLPGPALLKNIREIRTMEVDFGAVAKRMTSTAEFIRDQFLR
jgi:iron(III) transport system substrate-binding protein